MEDSILFCVVMLLLREGGTAYFLKYVCTRKITQARIVRPSITRSAQIRGCSKNGVTGALLATTGVRCVAVCRSLVLCGFLKLDYGKNPILVTLILF